MLLHFHWVLKNNYSIALLSDKINFYEPKTRSCNLSFGNAEFSIIINTYGKAFCKTWVNWLPGQTRHQSPCQSLSIHGLNVFPLFIARSGLLEQLLMINKECQSSWVVDPSGFIACVNVANVLRIFPGCYQQKEIRNISQKVLPLSLEPFS